ncbi:hypothetical protein ABE096_01570 [Robertmurraya massiliosenegalensis]|uniref:hypothetical protein n=1 Tax=Robertmurraya TaxID=2837507 RepID=UPI0039A6FEC7
MEIHYVTSSTYSVLEHRKGKYRLVKIVGEYESRKEAFSDLVDLLENMKNENQVEKEKWKNRKG